MYCKKCFFHEEDARWEKHWCITNYPLPGAESQESIPWRSLKKEDGGREANADADEGETLEFVAWTTIGSLAEWKIDILCFHLRKCRFTQFFWVSESRPPRNLAQHSIAAGAMHCWAENKLNISPSRNLSSTKAISRVVRSENKHCQIVTVKLD